MKERVLIIEDEHNIRRMIRLVLEAEGYVVTDARDGMKGLEAFGDGSLFELVLLDQKMPGMEGLDVLREIKARQPAARVVMLTAYASIELAVDAMKAGATDFIRKPITPEVLRGAIKAALSKHPSANVATSPHNFQQDAAQSASAIQTITMNGFSILRTSAVSDEQNERRFVVKAPDGAERVVVVEIENELIAHVERVTRRALPPTSSFWTTCAESFLSVFIWNDGAPPSGGRLTLKALNPEELTLARDWEGDSPFD